jgi:hypothetical protein
MLLNIYIFFSWIYPVHALNKLPCTKLDSETVGVREGVIFSTYHSLISSTNKDHTRMQQLVEWCGPGFDGLIIFDEVSDFFKLILFFV